MCAHALRSGADLETAKAILETITTEEAMEIIRMHGLQDAVMEQMAEKVHQYMQHRVEGVTETAPATTAGTTAATTRGTTTTEPASMQQSDTNMPYKSFYKYPVSESVQQSYNEELTFNRTMGDYRAHAAVDFKANKGAKVTAINDGLVLSVKTDALLGKVITIDHGGNLVAQYCGMDVVHVSAGNYVTLGQDLGTLGTVPFEAEEAPHLHLITTMNKETVDPLKVMSKTKD